MIIGGEKNFSGKVLFFSPYLPLLQKKPSCNRLPYYF